MREKEEQNLLPITIGVNESHRGREMCCPRTNCEAAALKNGSKAVKEGYKQVSRAIPHNKNHNEKIIATSIRWLSWEPSMTWLSTPEQTYLWQRQCILRNQLLSFHEALQRSYDMIQILINIVPRMEDSQITLDGVSERDRNGSKRYIGHHMSQCVADRYGDQHLEQIHIDRLQKKHKRFTINRCRHLKYNTQKSRMAL